MERMRWKLHDGVRVLLRGSRTARPEGRTAISRTLSDRVGSFSEGANLAIHLA
jgi:hypothetical protein